MALLVCSLCPQRTEDAKKLPTNLEGKGAGWCGGGEEVPERGPGHSSPVIALCATNPGGAATAPEGSHTMMDTVFHVLFRDHKGSAQYS